MNTVQSTSEDINVFLALACLPFCAFLVEQSNILAHAVSHNIFLVGAPSISVPGLTLFRVILLRSGNFSAALTLASATFITFYRQSDQELARPFL